jgi:PAS domain S-box-containing protein
MHRAREPLISPRDYTQAIEALRQQVAALEQRRHGPDEPPSALIEAVEGLSVALEELQAANEQLFHSHVDAAGERWRYHELFEFAPDGYLVTDLRGIIQEANRAAAALLHITPHRLPGKPLLVFVAQEDRQRFLTQLSALQDSPEVHDWEVRLQPRQQPLFPAALSIAPARNAQGQVVGLRWLVRDITAPSSIRDELEQRVQERTAALQAAIAEHQRTEERLQAALEEKEILLREVHHRVKNNLQVIASLLDLQADMLPDPQLHAAVEDSQQRIQAMALIHESLYQGADLARVNAADYLRRLSTRLFEAYGAAERIALQLEADAVRLEVNTAIPCGLILNELVSNALKYAFPDGRAGEVHIALRQARPGTCMLMVRDTGVGFPENIDFRHTNALGWQLICVLAEQLGGVIALGRQDGTTVTVTFPLPEAELGEITSA